MTRRVAILVTGSRDWSDESAVVNTLIHRQYRDRDLGPVLSSNLTLIHGDAPGLDTLAAEYARGSGWTVLAMPAQWDKHGKAAGAMRNGEMVRVLVGLRRCGYECRVIAFPLPSSRGTWDCVKQARKAGFEAVIVGDAKEPVR